MESNFLPTEMTLLLQSKLTPPQPEARLVRRKEANILLAGAERSTLVLACAPAGYGKTTLLTHWREELIRRGFLVPWYNLSPTDNDPAIFASYFLGGLEKVGCSIPLKSKLLHEAFKSSATREGILAQILNSIHSFDGNVTFFLDNIDIIDNPETCKFIENLLYNAPANLQFAMATRRSPKIHISRLSALGKVLKIGPHYLQLDYPETCEFVRSRLGRSFSADTCQVMHEITNGWPGALQLLTSELQRTGTSALIQPDDERFRKVFFEFVEEDVLRSMSPDTLNALAILSIEQCMPKSLFIELTQDSEPQPNLDKLSEIDPLIETIDQGDYYQCPALLHEYFCRYLNSIDHERISALQRCTGEWFKKKGTIDKAIGHFLIANEFKEAINLLEANAHQLVVGGQSDRFLDWLERLPSQELSHHPSLVLAQTWAWAMSYEYDRATEAIGFLEQQKKTELSTSQLNEIFLIRAVIAAYSDDQETMHQLLESKETWSFIDDPFFQSIATNAQSWYYIQQGDFEKARSIQDPLDRWTVEDRSFIARLYCDLLIGLSYSAQGQVEEAEVIYRNELACSEARLGRGSMPACISSGFLVDVLYEKGCLEEVIMVLSQRFDMICNLSIPDAIESAYINSARARFGLGDKDGAIDILRGMEEIGRERGMVRLLASAWENLIWIKLRSNDFNGIRRLQGRLESLSPRNTGSSSRSPYTFPDANLKADLSKARLEVWEGNYATAKKNLLRLYSTYETGTRWRLQVKLAAMITNCLQLSGDLDGAIKVFAKACINGKDLGLIHTITDEIEKLEELISAVRGINSKPREDEASPQDSSASGSLPHDPQATEDLRPETTLIEARKIDLDYLQRLESVYQKIDETSTITNTPATSNNQFTPAKPALQRHINDQLTVREKQILTMIVQGLPNKYIAKSLDVSMDTVKWHLKNLYKKLGVHDRASANIKARRLSLVEF